MLLFFFYGGNCLLQPHCGYPTISQLNNLKTKVATKMSYKEV